MRGAVISTSSFIGIPKHLITETWHTVPRFFLCISPGDGRNKKCTDMRKIYLSVALLTAFVGCQKENDEQQGDGNGRTIVLSLNTLEFTSDGGKRSITVRVEDGAEWSVENGDAVTWCEVIARGDAVEFTVDSNKSPDERQVTYRFVAEGEMVELPLRQKGKKPQRNKIYYTSSDGAVVVPKRTADLFGPGVALVDNTYSAGEGVLTFDGEIQKIGPDAFWNCENLKTVILPEGIEIIGEYAFGRCTALERIDIPQSVRKIGARAFHACTALSAFPIPTGVEEIGEEAFNECAFDLTIYPKFVSALDGFKGFLVFPDDAIIPDDSSFADNLPYYLAGFKGKYASDDHHCLISDHTLVSYMRGGAKQSYQTPKGIRKIGAAAFRGVYMYPKIANLRISEGVEEIADSAFMWHPNDFNCLELPGSLKRIGYRTLQDCWHLKYIACRAETPPMVDRILFTSDVDELRIFVPEQSLELYRSADVWKEFADRIEGFVWRNENDSPIFTSDIWPY